MVQYGAFRPLKWAISHDKMVYIAKRKDAPLKLNYWYSISYENLLFFAYLRPEESRSANTRLFFGVYKETKSEKSKNGYNLKVANIVSIPREENLLSAE